MNLRDNLNTEEGFFEIIQRQNEYIKEEYEDLNDLPQENKEKYICDTYATISKYLLDNIVAKYSIGQNVTNIKTDIIELISIFENHWNSQVGYIQMLWLLSISIMLEVETDKFNQLVVLVKNDNPNDFLIDFLINYRKNNWNINYNYCKFEKPYKSLVEVIDLAKVDKVQSLQRLKLYLDKEWYKGHSACGWHDSHKSENNIYSGYWSFESGAIVKILGLDDSSLKNQKYYPYDMVH